MHPFPDHSQPTHLRRPPDRLTIGGPVRVIPTTALRGAVANGGPGLAQVVLSRIGPGREANRTPSASRRPRSLRFMWPADRADHEDRLAF
jgi:hypothetical protein